jgi:hypothetical protein
MKTVETPKGIENGINPVRLFYYYAVAFVVVWAIIIAAIFTTVWLMGRLTK